MNVRIIFAEHKIPQTYRIAKPIHLGLPTAVCQRLRVVTKRLGEDNHSLDSNSG